MAKRTKPARAGAPTQRRYTPEFKRDAVALYEASGKSIAAVARELGISDVTLGGWIHDQAKQHAAAESEETAADRAEAARLRKEIKELKDEIEILKRFTAYWVKEGGE